MIIPQGPTRALFQATLKGSGLSQCFISLRDAFVAQGICFYSERTSCHPCLVWSHLWLWLLGWTLRCSKWDKTLLGHVHHSHVRAFCSSIIEFPELEGPQKDCPSPAPGPAQESPRVPPCAWVHPPNTLEVCQAGAVTIALGNCSSAQTRSGGRACSWQNPKPPMTQLQAIPRGEISACPSPSPYKAVDSNKISPLLPLSSRVRADLKVPLPIFCSTQFWRLRLFPKHKKFKIHPHITSFLRLALFLSSIPYLCFL